jgi:hypothetical protein
VGIELERWQERAGIARWGFTAAAVVLLGGCSALASSTTGRMADSVAGAIVNQNDPETVRQGAPAYLVLLDGLIADDPDNPEILVAGAELYSTYAGAFVDDPERAKRLAVKGRDYGWRGLCQQHPPMCGTWTAPYDAFEAAVATLDDRDVPAAFSCAGAWATWIRANREDWSAVADKARVDALIRRVIALEPGYRDGAGYLYLGVLETLLPAALGGHPEEGKRDFEHAIELSGGRNLMAKVLLASEYARLTFDRELHDRLCHEVLAASPEVPGLTLSNALAQEQARLLLASSDEYFGE